MSGNIFNSNGTHVAVLNGAEVFDLDGQKIYELKGTNLYRLSGELVRHLNSVHGTEKRLDRSAGCSLSEGDLAKSDCYSVFFEVRADLAWIARSMSGGGCCSPAIAHQTPT